MKYINYKKFSVFNVAVCIGLFNITAFAAEDTGMPSGYLETMGMIVFLLLAVMFITILFFGRDKFEKDYKFSFSLKTLINRYITRTVPLEKERDIMLDHDYDGIKELDNTIPPWFNILFYGSVAFAVVYMFVYHVFNISPLQLAEYNEEMTIAQMQKDQLMKTGALINEENVTVLNDEASLNNGKSSFVTNCSPCHAVDGGGSVGPNLTDDYWINGGGINNVFKTIKYGVPAKGMIPWQNALSPKKLQEISSYVLSLRGTKPQVPKQPEGTIYQDSLKTSPVDSVKNDVKKIINR